MKIIPASLKEWALWKEHNCFKYLNKRASNIFCYPMTNYMDVKIGTQIASRDAKTFKIKNHVEVMKNDIPITCKDKEESIIFQIAYAWAKFNNEEIPTSYVKSRNAHKVRYEDRNKDVVFLYDGCEYVNHNFYDFTKNRMVHKFFNLTTQEITDIEPNKLLIIKNFYA